jgi:hypothetical protein
MSNFAKRSAALARNPNVVFDAKDVLKGLNAIEPGLKKQMLKDMKFISKDMVKEIKSQISPISPFGTPKHTEGQGRLSWNYGTYRKTGAIMKPNNVIASFRSGRSLRSATTSLFGVWIRNPMVALAANAGKGSGVARYADTKEYAWRGTRRKHRNGGQGQILINKVRKSGYANFHYDTAEANLPDVEQKIILVWEKYSKIVTRKYF